jgi:TIR domain
MRVFISWSGPVGERVAEAVKIWLRGVIQATRPFASSQGIAAGARSMAVLAKELESADFGIVCVSKSTQHSPWINFEAGALAKSLSRGMVAPLLIDLNQEDLDGPLSQFQSVDSRDRESVLRFAHAINQRLGDVALPLEELVAAFDRPWRVLEGELRAVRLELERGYPAGPGWDRSTRELVEECLVILRTQRHPELSIRPAPRLRTNVTASKARAILLDRKLYRSEKKEIDRHILAAVTNYLTHVDRIFDRVRRTRPKYRRDLSAYP